MVSVNIGRKIARGLPLLFTLSLLLLGPIANADAPSGDSPDDLPVITANLSLIDALRLADRDNIQIAQTIADSAMASASAAKAESALQPSLSATTYATTGSESSIFTSSPGVSPQNIFALPRNPFADQDVTFMLPLTTGGILQDRLRSAAESANASRSDVNASRLSAQESVTEDYVNVLLQQALLSSAQSTLSAEQEQVRITKAKVDNGALAPVDLMREQAALADAQSGVTQAQTNVDLAEVDLKGALGLSQMSALTLSDTLNSLTAATNTMPATLADAVQFAEKNRPELAAAQLRLSAAKANISAAKGEFAPQVYAVGMADAMANQDVRGQTGYTVGLTASIPLYDGGNRHADVGSANAALARTEADERNTKVQIESQVSKAWFEFAASSDQITSAQAGLTAALQGYDLANLRYNAGKSTTADRLDALQALSKAQATFAQAQTNEIDGQAALAQAIGL